MYFEPGINFFIINRLNQIKSQTANVYCSCLRSYVSRYNILLSVHQRCHEWVLDPVIYGNALSFLCYANISFLFCRWNAIVSALGGSAGVSTDDVYLTTNALFYKYFEHWGFGKGIDVSHIINSGRSIGDAR